MLGAIVQILPIYILEYPASRRWSFFWKDFVRGMPIWVVACIRVLELTFVAHLVWFALQSGWGVPEILDGQYILGARGHILRVISQAEYLRLREGELRVFSSLVISFYFVHMTYWLFRRSALVSPKQALPSNKEV